MSAVLPQDSTYSRIETLVRRLTALSSQQALPSSEIQTQVNIFYSADFPYAIKLDQMRDVYSFFTVPYQDRYPLDVNYNQGVRDPVYIDGIQGYFCKDRRQFFNTWPKWPTKFQFGASSATSYITGITQTNPGVVTAPNHGLSSGNTVYIQNVVGMTQVNNLSFIITVLSANTFSIGVDCTSYTAYSSGGTWTLTPVLFQFTCQGPFLSEEVTIGGTDVQGNNITITDDGNGGLWQQFPNPVVSVPTYASTYPSGPNAGMPIPGMYNRNTLNPGLNAQTSVGTVDYVSGQFAFALPLPLQAGTILTIWVSQYQTGKPYSVLFWNNEFHIRPVPKLAHKITIETYLTPVQFMMTTDNPILNQWAQYISYGVACEILRQRQDLAGVENLMEGFKRQEGMVLERQGTEEINQRNSTVFASTTQGQGGNWFNNGGYY